MTDKDPEDIKGFEPLLTARQEGPVLTLTLRRPGQQNALNGALLAALGGSISAVQEDSSVRCVVITGYGKKAFSAGADLSELTDLDAAAAFEVLSRGSAVLDLIEQSDKPVIAAVNGLALGGGFEVALACSFILASENASFGLPETGLGLIPGYGGTQRLPALVGRHASLHMILTGRRISADRAYELGLVALSPMPVDQLLETAQGEALRIAMRAPIAAKTVLGLVPAVSRSQNVLACQLETALAAFAIASEEGREGIASFIEHRTPDFLGDTP